MQDILASSEPMFLKAKRLEYWCIYDYWANCNKT